MLRIFLCFLIALFMLPVVLKGQSADGLMSKATAAVESATPRAQADPAGKGFSPKAGWRQAVYDPSSSLHTPAEIRLESLRRADRQVPAPEDWESLLRDR